MISALPMRGRNQEVTCFNIVVWVRRLGLFRLGTVYIRCDKVGIVLDFQGGASHYLDVGLLG